MPSRASSHETRCHLPSAALADSLQRMEQPIGMIEAPRFGLAFRADEALAARVIGVALHPHHPAVLDVRKYAALAVARLADSPDDGSHPLS